MMMKKRGLWKQKSKKWKKRLVNLWIMTYFGYLVVRILGSTIRKKWVGLEKIRNLRQKGQHVIFVFWHGRLLMMPFINLGRKTGILSSHHVDAEISTRIYHHFGYYSIRGSTSSGGMAGLRKLTKEIKKGSDGGISPDGPRGPRYQAQGGAVLLAHLTGCPLIPVTFAASRGKILPSWDRFLIPYPFSRGVFIFDDPIWVSKGEKREGLKNKQRLLEERLNTITKKADEYFVNKGKKA